MKHKKGGESRLALGVSVYSAKPVGPAEKPKKKKRLDGGPIWWKAIKIVLIFAVVGIATYGAVRGLQIIVPDGDVEGGETEVVSKPVAKIVDEGNGGISSRVELFVYRLEQEAGDLGIKLEKVVLPLGKVREVYVYLQGREEYYKMVVDRSPAVMIEDANRVMRYLEGQGIKAEYVDVRVEGRAFIK